MRFGRREVVWIVGPVFWGIPTAVWGFLDRVKEHGTQPGSLKFALLFTISVVLGYWWGVLWGWLLWLGMDRFRGRGQ